LPPQDWKPSRPATKPCTKFLSRSYTRSNKTYRTTRTSQSESPDHPEQSGPFRHWKRPSPVSTRTIILNTKFQTTPPETDAGNAHQVFIPCPSQNYSSMTFRKSTTKIKSLETKWRRYSNRIHTCQTKFRRPIRHLRKNSRTTPLWPWFPRRWPPTCSSGTTTEIKDRTKRSNSPRGRNHFSKRRSESKSYIDKNKSESTNSKSESTNSKSENKDKNTRIFQDHQYYVTAKADEVKTMSKTKREVGIEIGKQLDNSRKYLTQAKPDLPFLPHLPLATTFTIHLLIFKDFLIFNFRCYFQPLSLRTSRVNPFGIQYENHNFTFKTSTANEATTPHSEVTICTQPLISITRLLLNTSNGKLISFLLSRNYTKKRVDAKFLETTIHGVLLLTPKAT
jgi:hypothetical protein